MSSYKDRWNEEYYRLYDELLTIQGSVSKDEETFLAQQAENNVRENMFEAADMERKRQREEG